MKTKNPSLVGLKSPALFVAFLLITSGLSLFGQGKTDFSGNWKLNESKSQLGDGPGRRGASSLVIKQDATGMSMERTSTRQNGETMTFTEKYTFDGKTCDNSTGIRQKSSTVAWSADNKEMTISSVTTFERDGNKMEMKSKELYKLSADKQSLTIEVSGSSPRGDYNTTLVYDLTK